MALDSGTSQAGRFSLKKIGTYSNVSDLTTKHHDEERQKVLMTLGTLRYSRAHLDAVSTANQGQTAAVVAWDMARDGSWVLMDAGRYGPESCGFRDGVAD